MKISSFLNEKRSLLVVIALLVEVLGLWPLITQVQVAEYDEAVFLDVARNIQSTGVPLRSNGASGTYYFIHTPLYPYLLSPVAGSADERVLRARLITTVFGIGCVWLVFLIGEKMKHATAGFIAALFTAASSYFLLHSFFVTMEVPMVFLMLLSLYWFVQGERLTARRWTFAAGMALAGAVLVKEIALGLAVVYLVYGLFISRQPKRAERLILSVGPAFAMLSGWIVWAWMWSPTQAQAALNRWFASAVSSSADFRMQIDAVQWSTTLGNDLLGWSVVVLSLISLYFCARFARKEMRVVLVPVLYIVVALMFSYVVRLKELRHLIAVIPMVALVIGVGVSQFLDDWQLRRPRLTQLLLGLLLVAAILDASPLRLTTRDHDANDWLDALYAHRLYENDRYYAALRSTGNYLAQHTQPEEVLVVVHEAPVVAFYADRSYSMLYVLPFDTIMETLSHSRYLVLDDQVFSYLDEEQIKEVVDYVTSNFRVEQEIAENGRSASIYRKTESN